MSTGKDPAKKAEEANRDLLVATTHLEQQERYLALLRHAQRIRVNAGLSDILEPAILKGQEELDILRRVAVGNLTPRRRPKKNADPLNRYLIYVDECGSSTLKAPDPFNAFIIAAVLIPEIDYGRVDSHWKKWKYNNLGSTDKIIHEPDLRKGSGPFYFDGNIKKREQVIQSLNDHIDKIPFSAVVCSINRPEYLTRVGTGSLDPSLPSSLYLMALDFLLERVVLALETQFNGAFGHIIAEARGPLEDALLQYEYVRLHLDGTSYISPSWFRQQLTPSIEFKLKKDNVSGLQIADLLARPCGEKILDPKSTPVRWPEFKGKLCPGMETMHSILGFKIVPWAQCYSDIWKS